MLLSICVALALCIIESLVIFLVSVVGGIVYLGIDGVRQGYSFWKMQIVKAGKTGDSIIKTDSQDYCV